MYVGLLYRRILFDIGSIACVHVRACVSALLRMCGVGPKAGLLCTVAEGLLAPDGVAHELEVGVGEFRTLNVAAPRRRPQNALGAHLLQLSGGGHACTHQ